MSMFSQWMGQDTTKKVEAPNSQQNNNQQQQSNNNNNQQNNNNNQQQQGGGSNKDDTSNDGLNIDKIWEDTTQQNNQNNQQQQQNNQNNGQQQQQQNQQTPEEQIAGYLKQQGLEPILLSDADKELVKNGDFDGVMSRINTNITNAHINAVKAASTLVKNEVKKAMDEANKNTRNYVDGLDVRKALQADPELKSIASDPVFGPNVEAIFSQYLGKPNSTRELALKATKTYFTKMLQKFDPNAQVNSNRGGNFRTPQNSGDTDWLQTLRGQ